MKINFTELEKTNYESGRQALLKAGYVQNNNAVDHKEEYSINDEYYTLYDKNDNELHAVSYVTYTKDSPDDEPELINEKNWHWSEISHNWGGRRSGAGRPATGAKPNRTIRMTDDEYIKVKNYLKELRASQK